MSGRIIIHGAGGHTRTVISILLQQYKPDNIICIDIPKYINETILKVRVMDNINYYPDDLHIISIGENNLREKKFKELQAQSYKIGFCISQKSFIYNVKEIKKPNNCIAHGVYIGPEVSIGYNNIINNHAVIEHEVIIGNNVHIAPGAILLGRVKIGNNSFIGANSTIRDGICICNNVIVGAGSVVVKDINTPGIYVGCPAKRLNDK